MRDSWQRRIERASELGARDEANQPLLEAYKRLLVLQRDCADAVMIQYARPHVAQMTADYQKAVGKFTAAMVSRPQFSRNTAPSSPHASAGSAPHAVQLVSRP